MQALSSIDYDGFISLAWKPEWMPDLHDPEVIFPHFVNYMHRFDSPRKGRCRKCGINHIDSVDYVYSNTGSLGS